MHIPVRQRLAVELTKLRRQLRLQLINWVLKKEGRRQRLLHRVPPLKFLIARYLSIDDL
jgi:hypothetical protein